MNNDGDLPELLRRRLDLIGRLSQATSHLQRWAQERRSADFDALRCELSGDALETARELQHDLYEAQCRAEEAETGMARCEALIAEIEQSLAETDAEIGAAARR